MPIRLIGCATDPAIDGTGVLFRYGADEVVHDPVDVEAGRIAWHARTLHAGRVGPGQGVLSIDGYAPVDIAWTDGWVGIARCTPTLLKLEPPTAFVVGTVATAQLGRIGRGPHGWSVVGCGGHAAVDAQGRFRMAVRPGDTCTVGPWSEDGRWSTAGEVIAPSVGSELTLALSGTPVVLLWRFGEIEVTREGIRIVDGSSRMFEAGDVVTHQDGKRLRPGNHPVERLSIRNTTTDASPHVLRVVRAERPMCVRSAPAGYAWQTEPLPPKCRWSPPKDPSTPAPTGAGTRSPTR